MRQKKPTSDALYFGFKSICSLKASINRSIMVLLKDTLSKIVIGRNIRSCSVLNSSAFIRIKNSGTPARVGFTRIFTNCMVSADISLMTCESL